MDGRARYGPDYEERDCGYDTPCWIWLKGLNDGKPIKYIGTFGKVSAGRYYYEQVTGEKLKPTQILYSECQIKLCINPEHKQPMGHRKAGRTAAKARLAKKKREERERRAEEKHQAELERLRLRASEKAMRDARKEKMRHEWKTYFVQQGDDGPIKIGISTNVQTRVWNLQTASPYELKLLKTVDGAEAETEFHRTFRKHRINGEWFNASDELLAAIDGL